MSAKVYQTEPSSLDEAVSLYMDAIHQYEASRTQPSYSVIEIPKLQIADQILKLLDLPTGPRANASERL